MIRTLRFTVALALVIPALACSEKIDHVKRAQDFAAQKKYKEAIIEYRAALQDNERNGAVRLAMGDAYADLGDGLNAFHEYVRASDLLPKNVDAQLKAGAILLMSGQFKEAAARGDRALRVEPKNASALMLVGTALAGMKNTPAALRRLNEAIEADPSLDVAYTSVGAVEMIKGEIPEAEASFKRAVTASPRSVVARIALAQFYQMQGRLADAEAALKEAAGIDPQDVRVNRGLSQLYMATGRAEAAEAPLKAVADAMHTTDSQIMLADYYIQSNRAGQAVPLLEKLASNNETYATATVRLAALSYTQGRAADAEKTVDEVLKRQPKNRDALLLKGRLLLFARKYDAALPVLKAAADADPARAAEPTMFQANVYLSRGQMAEARDVYKDVLRLAPGSTGAQLALSKLYAATGQNKDAMDLALSAVRQDPANGDARLNLERRLFAAGDLEGAAREMNVLQETFAPSVPILIEAAALSAARNDRRAARTALEKALSLDPSSRNAIEGLIALDLAGQDKAAARTRIEARLQQAPRDAGAWFLAGQLYAAIGDQPRQEQALKKTIELTPSNFRAFSMLGQLYGAQGKLGEAKRQFETWMAREPRAVAPRTMVGLLLEQEGNQAAARKLYEETIEIDPRAAVAANNLAWMYTEKGENAEEARRLAEMAVAQAPDIADFNDTLGWVYYRADLTSTAIPLFQKAVASDQTNPNYHYHLGMAYVKQRNESQARSSLKQALTLNASFPNAADARAALASLD